jgi:hypothetical protein
MLIEWTDPGLPCYKISTGRKRIPGQPLKIIRDYNIEIVTGHKA